MRFYRVCPEIIWVWLVSRDCVAVRTRLMSTLAVLVVFVKMTVNLIVPIKEMGKTRAVDRSR